MSNLKETIEQEELENDRSKLTVQKKKIDDIKWQFIDKLLFENEDHKVSDKEMSLFSKYTEFLKKELGL